MSLCQECASMNLAKTLDAINRYFDLMGRNRRAWVPRTQGSLVHLFGDRLSDDSTKCPACVFFRQMRIEDSPGVGHRLVAYCSSTDTFLLHGPTFAETRAGGEIIHNVYLVVEPTACEDGPWLGAISRVGMIYPVRSTVNPAETGDPEMVICQPRILRSTVDYSLLNKWLRFCKDHHGGQCSNSKEPRSQDLQGFRVIDCLSEQLPVVGLPENDVYVALSYVWGDSERRGTESGSWPMVVKDAAEVVKRLGKRYLWVDQFCIDQEDDQEKAYLISKMALIYEDAEFTIIAAAGTDANHGLPGVGLRERPQQLQTRLSDGVHLVSTMQHPRTSIRESAWSARGWTYQEGVLSRRRLIFTKQQVYFECQGMTSYESLEIPLSLYHRASPSMSHMDDYMRSGIFSGRAVDRHDEMECYGFDNSHKTASHIAHELDEHIIAFSRRRLRYDEDSLAAFQGISERYCSIDNGPDILLGIPVWNLHKQGCDEMLLQSFAFGLASWLHEKSSPDWSSGRIERKIGLPSWIWAGWKSRVVFSRLYYAYFSELPRSVGEQRRLNFPRLRLETRGGDPIFDFSRPNESASVLSHLCQCSLRILSPFMLDPTALKTAWLHNAFLIWSQDGQQKKGALRLDLSLEMDLNEVLANHDRGDMMRILMYLEQRLPLIDRVDDAVGQFAAFVVIRRVPQCSAWERVGALQWEFREADFEYAGLSTIEALRNIPLLPLKEDIVIC